MDHFYLGRTRRVEPWANAFPSGNCPSRTRRNKSSKPTSQIQRINRIISNCSKEAKMVSSRAIELMRELMKEVGVAGALLPTKDGGLEAQLSLDVSDIPEEMLQDIFLSDPS